MANRKLYQILKQVKQQLAKVEQLGDKELKGKTEEFRNRLMHGESLNSLLPEAFAVVCEADRRILGMMPFDCQIMGAAAMHYCYLVEMNTGEGKTLTATMPLYLNALTGKSTILVTANDYLAIRDAEEMGPVFRFLGLTVKAGVRKSDENFTTEEKQEIYRADIVYTTHGTLGFDYLLNNLVVRAEDRFLREFYYAIVDEADMVLLDAAQMPLVIAGSPRVQSNLYELTDFFVTTLEEERDYILEDRSVWLTDEGVRCAERFFGIRHYYSRENFEINRHVSLALRAHLLFENGKDYVVTPNGEAMLLDNGTGRLLPGMKLRSGMHQAIEAKEKLKISQENRSVASVTYQNLFKLFPRLSGMSGTISDARQELRKVYKKKVAVIPPNRPMIRKDYPAYYFKTADQQYEAAVKEIVRLHAAGQPVLAVTNIIADTERVSHMLLEEKIPHSVLNANNAFWESEIIKEAGQLGTVTVSTGMAGRGTDIRLGAGVAELGGLAVICIGRMANVRLERQAKGRAGRQGDPGCSCTYVSLEDEVVKAIGEKRLEKLLDEKRRISTRRLKRLINGTQKLQEEKAVSSRQSSVDYDRVMKRQRDMMYEVRNRLLDGESLSPGLVYDLAGNNAKEFLKGSRHLKTGDISHYVLDHIAYDLSEGLLSGKLSKRCAKWEMLDFLDLKWEQLTKQFQTEEEIREYIRLCALRALDDAWVEQVDYLQQLQYVVSGRATAQRNPLYEFQKEAYRSFQRMENDIKCDITRNVLLGERIYNKQGEMVIQFP